MNNQLALVFPGQGSQEVGMLQNLANQFPVVLEVFAEASAVLGYDLWQLVQHGPAQELNQTEKTQPALLCAGYAVWKVWQALGGAKPKILAGHSLGEYTALVCAEALDFKTAVKCVAARGRYMQEAVPSEAGAMAAIIGLDDGRVEEICDKAAEEKILTPANYNCIGQVVIAGEKIAVERAILLANDAGCRLAKILQVSVPSHCPLMEPAASKLEALLTTIEIKTPTIDVINNVDVAIYKDSQAIKDALVRQLSHPVQWVDTILKMRECGITQIIECGPGRVLSGLIKRIDRELNAAPIAEPTSLQESIRQLV